jgi:hypothetical protein
VWRVERTSLDREVRQLMDGLGLGLSESEGAYAWTWRKGSSWAMVVYLAYILVLEEAHSKKLSAGMTLIDGW